MDRGFVARASIVISAPVARVWNALVDPEKIRQYMFGVNVISDWREGGSIVWKGEWLGKAYEDRGVILTMERGRVIQYSHFSPLSGIPDAPEYHHIVTIELSGDDSLTIVTLSQDNNPTEQARVHSQKNWELMLESMKNLLER
jgi:uncharacterized protein YndB with AHSA1/START domain